MKREYTVTFEDLSEEAKQKIIATTDDVDILWQGTKSKCMKTRIITKNNPHATDKMLQKMLKEAGEKENELVLEIIHDKRCIPTEKLFWSLYQSPNFVLRQWIAISTQDSVLLSEMMKCELSGYRIEGVMLAIFNNKYYIEEKQEVISVFQQLDKISDRCWIVKYIDKSEILSELLKLVTENYKYRSVDVIVEILNNTNFIPERAKINMFQQLYYGDREEIAEQVSRQEVIEFMLESEVDGDNDWDVITNLFENYNCKHTETIRHITIKHLDWTFRVKIAKECKDAELLSQQLETELEEENDEDVILAILNSFDANKFKLSETKMLKLSLNDSSPVRKYMAQLTDTPAYILENMYIMETEREVIEAIMSNENFKKIAEETCNISIFRKKKLFNILKKAGVENARQTLEELLEVINK